MIVFASLLLQRVSPLFILMLLSRLFPCRLILFLVQSILLERRSVLICRPLVFPLSRWRMLLLVLTEVSSPGPLMLT